MSFDSRFSAHQCTRKFLEDKMIMREVESLTVGFIPLTMYCPTIAKWMNRQSGCRIGAVRGEGREWSPGKRISPEC